MKLPKKHDNAVSPVACKINEVINFMEYFIRETQRCCTCNGCPRHAKDAHPLELDPSISPCCNVPWMISKSTRRGTRKICSACGKEADNRASVCDDCFEGDHIQCFGKPCACMCVYSMRDNPKTSKSLAQKFQAFREKRGNGSGTDYWQGLEDIANEYYHNL